MIIHDFDVVSVSIPPCETNPELIVDPNTVLAPAISFKRFQPETWEPEIFKRFRVPADQFSNIEKKLFQFNIHDLSLFPDTEGLAGFVKQKLRLQFQ